MRFNVIDTLIFVETVERSGKSTTDYFTYLALVHSQTALGFVTGPEKMNKHIISKFRCLATQSHAARDAHDRDMADGSRCGEGQTSSACAFADLTHRGLVTTIPKDMMSDKSLDNKSCKRG